MSDIVRPKVMSKIENGIQFLKLDGRITYDAIEEYKQDIKTEIVASEGYIIDLSRVDQIDSTGLGLLVNVAKNFIYNKSKMVILNDDEWINELFKVSKLNTIFQICSSKEEAMAAIAQEDENFWNKVLSY